MRCVLFGAVIAGAMAGPGLAADLPAAMPMKAPAYVPAFSWTGTYVGLNVGGAWSRTDFEPSTMTNVLSVGFPPGVTSYPTVTADAHSIIGGGQAGYNWQIGTWVLGFEQDFQFTHLNQGFTYAVSPSPPPVLGTVFAPLVAGDGFSATIKYMGATRARIGWAWDRVLLYAAGGLETAVVDATGNYVARPGLGPAALFAGSPAASFTVNNGFHVGWTIGAGFDYAVTNNIFLGFDYRYFDLGSVTYNLGAVTPAGAFIGAVPVSTVAATIHPRGSEFLARLNVKLNGLGLFGM